MIFELLQNLYSSLLLIIENFHYLGIFLGMTIESSFFPFPSEAILIPAGSLIKQGSMNLFLVFFLSVIGSLTGALINYSIAFFIGRKGVERLVSKYGHFLFIKQKSLRKSDRYFEKNGEITTFIGRLFPVVRQLISLPAGFSKMHLGRFCLYTSLGAGIWTLVLIFIGYAIGPTPFTSINNLFKIILILILGIIVLVYFIIKRKKKLKKKS